MAQKLDFELTRADGTDRYAIRLLDKREIAALALSEGFEKPIAIEPVVVTYDAGNGELVPVDGYDDSTARGRIALKILNGVYCDALRSIQARSETYEPAPRGETFVFQC